LSHSCKPARPLVLRPSSPPSALWTEPGISARGGRSHRKFVDATVVRSTSTTSQELRLWSIRTGRYRQASLRRESVRLHPSRVPIRLASGKQAEFNTVRDPCHGRSGAFVPPRGPVGDLHSHQAYHRRRVKVIGPLPGERSRLSAGMGCIRPGQPQLRGLTMTPGAAAAAGPAPPAPPNGLPQGGDQPSCHRCRVASS
jgi:hypothetical protein